MATSAMAVQVKVSGAAVAMTTEACALVSGFIYQITNTAKRILDPSVAVVVKDGATTIAAASVTIDYLFGRVTLLGAPAGAVTVTASYLPVVTIGECKSIELNISADLADVTSFDSAGAKKKLATLVDIAGSLDRFTLPLDDLDPVTAGTQSIDSWMNAGIPRLIDVLFTTGARVRAWVLFKGYKVSGQTAGAVEVSVDFEGSAQNGIASFGIGT